MEIRTVYLIAAVCLILLIIVIVCCSGSSSASNNPSEPPAVLKRQTHADADTSSTETTDKIDTASKEQVVRPPLSREAGKVTKMTSWQAKNRKRPDLSKTNVLPKIEEVSSEGVILSMKCSDNGKCKGSVAIAENNCDGQKSITVSVASNVDFSQMGEYIVTVQKEGATELIPAQFNKGSLYIEKNDIEFAAPFTIEVDCAIKKEKVTIADSEDDAFFSDVESSTEYY